MNVQSFFDERKYSWIPEEFPDSNVYPLYYKATKTEVILNEGEMLFIPAGWWHHVLSDKVGKNGVNSAFNFWYDKPADFREGVSGKDNPKKEPSNIVTDPLDIIKDMKDLRVFISTSNRFTSDRISYRYPGTLKLAMMSCAEFLSRKDPHSYLLQYTIENLGLEKMAPKHETILRQSSVWVNFGNVYSHIHYDLYDNWLCQVEGTRRVLLFRPEDRDYLYPINPYPVDLIHCLSHQPLKTKNVCIGTHIPDHYVSFMFSSSICKTCTDAQRTDIHIEPYTIHSNAPNFMVRNELVRVALENNCEYLFIVDRDVSWDPLKFLEFFNIEFDVLGIPHTYDDNLLTGVDDKLDGPAVKCKSVNFGFVGFSRSVLTKLWHHSPTVKGLLGSNVRDIFSCGDEKVCQKIRQYGFSIKVLTNYSANMLQHANLRPPTLVECAEQAKR